MKILYILLSTFLLFLHTVTIAEGIKQDPRNYFISNEGLDTNDGDKNSPWKTLAKISSIALVEGDTIFFERGSRFDGHFIVNGSGKEGNPIVVTAYGEGALPIITGEVGAENGGDYEEAILIENNSHIELSYLEINNERIHDRAGVNEDDAYGIRVLNSGNVSIQDFHFHHLTIQNVYAPKPILRDEGEDAFNSLEVSGIRFISNKNKIVGQEKNISNILVENCYFTDLQRLGIHIKHDGANTGVGNDDTNTNRDIVVRNNEFSYTGGTCVLPIRTYNTLIENNIFDHPGTDVDERMPARGSAVWTWRCFNTVIQKNQCLSTRGYLDSHGIHIDHENVNTFVQYNYMEDCEGGFVEILGGNENSVYRFNISVNDGWRDNPNWVTSNHTIWINEKVPSGDHFSDHNYIYHNTVYMDKDYDTSIDIDGKNTYIFNNIFYSSGGRIGGKQVAVNTNGETLLVSHNIFNGNIQAKFKNYDTNKITTNPLFVNPGTEDQTGYQLHENSPGVNAGMLEVGPAIPGAGTGVFKDLTAYPEVDYYGNPIDLFEGTPNIGASNNKLITVESVEFEVNEIALEVNETFQLNYTLIPEAANNKNVTWSVENDAIASVDENGLVTANSLGSTTITITTEDGNKTATCTLNVQEVIINTPSEIVVIPDNYTAQVSWKAEEDADHYNLQYRSGDEEWMQVNTISEASYLIEDLLPSVSYEVRVQAVEKGVNSNWSESIAFSTVALEKLPTPSITSITPQKNDVTIEWEAGENNSSFILQYKLSISSTWLTINLNNVSSNEYTIIGLGENTSYDIRIKAVNPNNESEWSEISTVNTLTDIVNSLEDELKEIKIYPNPTSSMLRIEMDQTPKNIQISDLYGRSLMQARSTKMIDLSSLQAGIYLLQIDNHTPLRVIKK